MLLAGWEGTDFVCSNRWLTRNNLSIIWISLYLLSNMYSVAQCRLQTSKTIQEYGFSFFKVLNNLEMLNFLLVALFLSKRISTIQNLSLFLSWLLISSTSNKVQSKWTSRVWIKAYHHFFHNFLLWGVLNVNEA